MLTNTEYRALKIGITTKQSRTDRIKEHQLQGWNLAKKWNVATGADAEFIESAVLRWWRNTLGAPEALTRSQMPSGGHTETAAFVYVDEIATIEVVDALVEEFQSS